MVIDNDVRSRVELVTTAMRGRPLLEKVAGEDAPPELRERTAHWLTLLEVPTARPWASVMP